MKAKEQFICSKNLILIIALLFFILSGCSSDEEETNNRDSGLAGNESGHQQLKSVHNLEIGDKVSDPSWEWGYRTDNNYTGSGELKPVIWVVVAKDHYDVEGDLSHVTLMADELVARYAFDDSTDRCQQMPDKGNSNWGDSGSTNAEHGLRPFLNSEFRGVMSENFRRSVLKTDVINAYSLSGEIYLTEDYVFVPSQTELGGSDHDTVVLGKVLPFFDTGGTRLANIRPASLDKEEIPYWTRSASADFSYLVRFVHSNGKTYRYYANEAGFGVRPLVNISAQVKVSHKPDDAGIYMVVWQ